MMKSMWNILKAELGYHKWDLAILYAGLTIFLTAFTSMDYKTFDKRMIYLSVITLVSLAVFLVVWKKNNRVSLHRTLPVSPLAHALSRILVHVFFSLGNAAILLTIVFIAMPRGNSDVLIRMTTLICFLIITCGLFLILTDIKACVRNRFVFFGSMLGFFLIYLPLWILVLLSYEPLDPNETSSFVRMAQTSNPLILFAVYAGIAIVLVLIELSVFVRRNSYIEKCEV